MRPRAKRQLYRAGRLAVVLFAALAALAAIAAGWSAAAPQAAVGTDTLDRDLEPVVLTGDDVSALSGAPLDDLFVYRYTGGLWQQIPSQVDEITESGDYTVSEDGLLDANDEIVFMAADLGDQASVASPISDMLDVVAPWYEIEVGDPTSPGNRAWGYIVQSTTLTPTFAADYVSYDGGLRRVNGQAYTLGFTSTHPTFEYLSLAGGDGTDILDRTKIRAELKGPGTNVITEEDLGSPTEDLVKDGAVRLVLRQGQGFAYGSMASWSLDLPALLMLTVDTARFSTDFTPVVSGSVEYNGAVPGGVTVDGFPDVLPATPFSPWWQLSTTDGTVIMVGDTTSVNGVTTNYYLDEATVDPDDTGDHMSFGDIGVDVDITGPGALSYPFAFYFLPGAQSNVGDTYNSYFGTPFSVTASLQGLPLKVYLPIVLAQ